MYTYIYIYETRNNIVTDSIKTLKTKNSISLCSKLCFLLRGSVQFSCSVVSDSL